MELLIRSQDRKVLMKIDTLSIALDEEGTILGYGTDGNVKVSLGNYQTEERALEVLDEIQKLLMPQVKIIHNKVEQERLQDFTSHVIIQPMIEDIQIQQAISYVYEMPEE